MRNPTSGFARCRTLPITHDTRPMPKVFNKFSDVSVAIYVSFRIPCLTARFSSDIQETRLLPPLMVIQILSRNQSIPLAIVKDFLLQSLTYEQSLLDDDRRRIDEYRAETADIRAKIERLETQPVSFQATTCSECNAMLSEPPVIHFLCMHSYHERCMENMQTTAAGVAHCPICYADYKKIVEIDESMKASASDHEAFFHKLHDADDGFAAVAEYFGRGIVEGLQTTATTTTSARLHHDRPSI